jgi:hypothetical protein
VRFPDDAPVPAADVPVRVAVSRVPLRNRDGRSLGPAADTQTIQLSKVEGSRATYQGLLTRTPEGDYRFVLADPPTNGNKPRAEATVLPPPGELERLDPDRVAMTRAATESRGKAYTLADADMVLNDLPDVPRVVLDQPVPPIPVWSHPALFGLVVIVFAAEWWLRRQERLL